MMSIITNAYTNVASSFYLIRFEKSIEELLVAPIPNYLILIGFAAGGVARSLIVGVIVTIIALVFTHLYIYSFTVVISVAFLTALLFSLAGFTNALFAKKFDDTMVIPTFVLTPLTYLGGVFYSLSLLPPVWRYISLFNPIVYMVNTFRFGFLGISDISLVIAFSILMSTVIILFLLNLYLLEKGVGIRT
jgi:ABC-2 type transport system permease protein